MRKRHRWTAPSCCLGKDKVSFGCGVLRKLHGYDDVWAFNDGQYLAIGSCEKKFLCKGSPHIGTAETRAQREKSEGRETPGTQWFVEHSGVERDLQRQGLICGQSETAPLSLSSHFMKLFWAFLFALYYYSVKLTNNVIGVVNITYLEASPYDLSRLKEYSEESLQNRAWRKQILH